MFYLFFLYTKKIEQKNIKKTKNLILLYSVFMMLYVFITPVIIVYSFFNPIFYKPIYILCSTIFNTFMSLLGFELFFNGVVNIITLIFGLILSLYWMASPGIYTPYSFTTLDTLDSYYDFPEMKCSIYYHKSWLYAVQSSDDIDIKLCFITMLLDDDSLKEYISQYSSPTFRKFLCDDINAKRRTLYLHYQLYEKKHGHPYIFPNNEQEKFSNLLNDLNLNDIPFPKNNFIHTRENRYL
jgi:hypothetical protein